MRYTDRERDKRRIQFELLDIMTSFYHFSI